MTPLLSLKSEILSPKILLVLLLATAIGCGEASTAGPVDARLIGKWESRRGFVGTDTIDFRSDGTANISSFDGKKKKSYTAQWYVKEPGEEQIKINMQARGKEEFRVRKVKFRPDGSFEMTEGGTIIGRFERKG